MQPPFQRLQTTRQLTFPTCCIMNSSSDRRLRVQDLNATASARLQRKQFPLLCPQSTPHIFVPFAMTDRRTWGKRYKVYSPLESNSLQSGKSVSKLEKAFVSIITIDEQVMVTHITDVCHIPGAVAVNLNTKSYIGFCN